MLEFQRNLKLRKNPRIAEAEPKNIVKSVKLGTVSELLGSKF